MPHLCKLLISLGLLLIVSACGGGGGGSPASNEPTLSISNASVTEGDSGTTQLTFTVSLSAAASGTVTVDYSSANGTATAGVDYTAATGTLTINAGATSGQISIDVIGDTDVESNETFSLNLSNLSGATLGTSTATGTIINDDSVPLPALSIGDASVNEGDSGTTNLSFTVNLSAVSGSDITVDYATSDDLASSGSDYVASSGSVTITAGNTSATITIAVNGDTLIESDETLIVTLSNPAGATLSDATATGTILNDDGATTTVVASIADAAVAEGNSGTTSLSFTVSLSSAPAADVTVDYTTSNGTAISPSDYSSASGTLTISAGQMSGTITVDVAGDTTVEPDETFTLTLGNPSANAVLDPAASTATGTINNDDVQTINVVDVQVKEGDSGTKAVTFYLNAGFSTALNPMSFDYATSNGTATAGSDYTATSGTISFNTGDMMWTTITVNVLGDLDVEPDETFTLDFSNASGVKLSANSATATIVNDDGDVSVANTRVTEGDSGTTSLVFTISLDQAVTGDVTVDYATGTGTAVDGIDYTSSSGTATILQGNTSATVAISVNGDTNVEQNEIVTLVLSNVTGNAVLGRSVAFGIIENDDGGRTVSVPKTGQAACFDGSGSLLTCTGTGQDGEQQTGVDFPMPRYVDNSDGTITDSLTGLMWPSDGNVMPARDPGYDTDGIADDGIITWQTALDYVVKLNEESYLGYNDWRLPNRNELRSMANFGVNDSAIDLQTYGFSNYSHTYWSSSSFFSATTVSAAAWVVNMASGYVRAMDKAELVAGFMAVVPVRGGRNNVNAAVPVTGQTKCYDTSGTPISCAETGQDGEYQTGAPWPTTRFVTRSDTTITDKLTGLTWAPDANVMATRDPGFDTEGTSGDGRVTWQTALDYVAKLNSDVYLGYDDWYLPNINEYQTLINIENQMTSYPAASGWLYTNGFSNIGDVYWTADSYFVYPQNAWSIHIGSSVTTIPYAGSTPAWLKTGFEYYVWPVRRGLKKLSTNVNGSTLDGGPEISNDDLELYFHSDRAGGQGSLDIWLSSRPTANDAWGAATNLGATINSSADDRAPAISSDKLTLIFVSNRAGGAGGNDIYVSTRASTSDPWGVPTSIGANINTAYEDSGPSISDDGLTLYFHSDRPGGLGNTDIYVSTRASTTDPWGVPVNLGSVVNSTDYDVAPDISSDGLTLYFHSTRPGSLGSHNIWMSTRATTSDPWSKPVALESPANSTAIETGACISSDNRTLYFASTRTGSVVRDIWQISR